MRYEYIATELKELGYAPVPSETPMRPLPLPASFRATSSPETSNALEKPGWLVFVCVLIATITAPDLTLAPKA
jgi:hypothetical protein